MVFRLKSKETKRNKCIVIFLMKETSKHVLSSRSSICFCKKIELLDTAFYVIHLLHFQVKQSVAVNTF